MTSSLLLDHHIVVPPGPKEDKDIEELVISLDHPDPVLSQPPHNGKDRQIGSLSSSHLSTQGNHRVQDGDRGACPANACPAMDQQSASLGWALGCVGLHVLDRLVDELFKVSEGVVLW